MESPAFVPSPMPKSVMVSLNEFLLFLSLQALKSIKIVKNDVVDEKKNSK